ncbi:membrane-associated, metal-dependent hydrolase [Legionella jordanis]|uniref:Membrane-associated, metal-dependent hydrolase n=2 Tax=Legionella jordanis TaxID=456 RepID=A0A0W0V9N1_9GAMM|nr:IS982 family transposase [Legionella jordanis]KTD16843.1 membrane-associated, metal-dependent hydrolase [Legionella jordanis]VEH11688.1 membrane-associated, metal-dependent hydrolase [Legionella jordanis]
MTVMILFHLSHYRTFKDYYRECVEMDMKSYFPKLVSYNRFVEIMLSVVTPLSPYLLSHMGKKTGLYYVDSTTMKVCHNKRIHRHKTFAGIAERGKSSMGWFFGFKLHLVINHLGELIAFCITKGNVDDRQPLEQLFKNLHGLAVADKGYLSKKKEESLFQKGLKLITKVRRNMKAKILSTFEKYFLGQRSSVETVIEQLKSICQIEHTRHRKPDNFVINLLSGLAAIYAQTEKTFPQNLFP